MITEKTNTLHGHLHLQEDQSTGTVALLDVKEEILSIAQVNNDGWFSLTDVADTVVKIFGVPGLVLNDTEMKAAIASPPAIHYEAIVSADHSEFVYVNGVSSIIASQSKLLKGAVAPKDVDKLKDYLFGKHASILLPGYSPEFLAHIAQPSSFSNTVFIKEAEKAGGIKSFSATIANEIHNHSTSGLRFSGSESFTETQTNLQSGSPAPAPEVPNAGNWASNESKWVDTFTANGKDAANASKNFSSMIDGLKASVTSLIDGFSFSDIASWAGGKLKDKVISLIEAQIFGYLEEWIFGKPQNPVLEALKEISAQLKTIIANQAAMVEMLSAILNELHELKQDAVLLALAAPVSKIQSTVKTLYQQSSTATPFKTPALDRLTSDILDSVNGLPAALELIHSMITGKGGHTNLPKTVLDCSLKKLGVKGFDQNFLSNANCYMNAQGLYQYYAMVQTQGAQLLMQAHNYVQNKNIQDFETKMPSSAMAKAVYNGIVGTGTDTSAANLIVQRDLYRTIFKPYYENFEGYMGVLPDDIAVCLIPEVEGQVAPVYYSLESKFLLLGVISYTLRNWTSNKNILAAQKACTTSNSWPFSNIIKSEFRLPSSDEIKKILGKAFDSNTYNGNYFTYLADQGLAHDFEKYKIAGADHYGANVMVWVTETAQSGERGMWGWNNQGGDGPTSNAYPPYDINGKECKLKYKNPRYQWWYEGTFPQAMQLQNNGSSGKITLKPYSSHGFDPNANSASWIPLGMPFLDYTQINGGLIIADPKKLA